MEVDQLESGVQVCAIVQTLVLTARARGKCPRWGGKLSTEGVCPGKNVLDSLMLLEM